MKTRFIVRSLVFVFALTAATAFAAEYHSSASFRCNTPAANSADSAWMARHAEKVAAVADVSVKKDIVFIGDELTADWETTGAAALATYFTGDKTMFNLGFAGDCTEHALWRIKNGELGNPKAIFLMIGGNNTATYLESEEAPGQTTIAVRDIIDYIRSNHGTTKLVVQAILPRGADESDPVRARNDQVNNDIRKYVQSVGCTWVDMSDLFLESDHHTLKTSLYNDDKETLNAAGYAVWGQAVQDYVTAAANGTAMPSDLVATARPSGVPAAAYPSFSTIVLDEYYWKKYDYDVSAIRNKSYDIVLLGDSITQKWSATDPSSMNGLATSVFNLGRSGDFTENLFWRLNSGCLDGYTTKYFNLLIGTNNTVQREPSMDSPSDIAAGVKAIIDLVLAKHPESKILLMPILPYGSKNNPEDAAAKHANNVAANEIIKTYADNQRVFLVDLDTSKFYLNDGSCNPEMYDATEAGLYYLHLSAKGYSEIIAPAIKSAMASTAALSVSFPQVGSVSAKVKGTAAMLTLSDVVKGTDASGTAASSYKVTYKLDTAAETTLAADETGDSATVEFADLADGWHTCAVTVSADGVVKSGVKRVKFQIDTNADKVGWKVAPMDADGSAFRDDGTQVFARGYTGKTVNGITFSSGFPSSEQATVSPSTYSGAGWNENNPVFGGGWVWSKSGSQDVVFTLKGLTSGRKYVVQILAANHWGGSSTTLSAGDLTPFEATKNNDYKYGAVFSRVFVASGSTEDVTIGFSGSNNNCLIKAVQLRELGAGSEEDPTHEDDPPAGSAWIPDPVPGSNSASEPCIAKERTDDYHKQHFAEDLSAVEKSHKNFDVVLFGDSITDFWVNPNLSLDGGLTNTVNMGIGSDRTQNLLWRVRNGALDGYTTKYLTLLIGVNNSHQKRIDENKPCDRPEDIADSIRLILNEMVAKHPESKILLMPIIPYCYDSRYYDGLEVRNTNEDVNDYIIKFVDNKRIFWVDFRCQFLNSDATCNHSWYRGNPGEYDAVGTCLHPAIASYSEIFKPALSSAMQKYLAVPAGTAQVVDPSLGYASAAPDGMDQSATITVCGIFLGTDSSAKPVTSYTLAYDLDNGAKVGELTNQTLTRNSFKIADVGPGKHVCVVKITTADGKVLTTSVDFAMTEGWTGASLPADSSAVRTDGTLKYAYAIGNYTVNTVPFTRAYGVIGENIDWPYESDSGSQAPAGVEAGGYSDLLTHCWWANQGEKTVTLKNLTVGENYLVQIFGYRNWDGFDKAHVWIKESFRDVNFIRVMGDGWTYGGVLTGVFTATAKTKTFNIVADSNYAINGIQVRDLGQGTITPIPVNPSVGSISASVSGSTATISLKSVVKGTDDEAVAATSYSVSYSLNSAAAVTALSNQSASTAEFDISNLADGDYTCSVTITTDKGKTSAAKSVNFTIKTSTPGGDDDPDEPVIPTENGWKVKAMTTESDLVIEKQGKFLYAYRANSSALTVDEVTFAAGNNAANMNIAFDPAFDIDTNSGNQFGTLLQSAWRWANTHSKVTLTLNGLTKDHDYLVQILAHNGWGDPTITVGDETPVYIGTGALAANIIGTFKATGTSASVELKFGGGAAWRMVNAVQVRDLGEGGDDPVTTVDPSIGSLTASVNGSVVTFSLSDIVFGTDDDGEAATSCSVYYSVTNSTGSEIKSGTVKNGLDAQTYAFDLNDFEDGDYTCGVMITTDKGKTASKTVNFTVKTSTPGGDDDPDEPVAEGWTATPMSETGDTIRKDGEFCYSYARSAVTVNSVAFEALGDVNLQDVRNSKKFAFSGDMNRDMNSDVVDPYANMLQHRFVGTALSQTLTLKELTAGKNYLVQLVLCFPDGFAGGTMVTAPDGKTIAKANGSGWENGGSLVGVFTATNSTVTFDLTFEKYACMNAIQVRELSGSVDPVDPEEPLPVYTLTIPVQDHLSVASVKTNNVAVTGSGNDYSIVSNTQVTITFAAETGYEITGGNPVVVTVESNMTLAEFPTVQEKQGGEDPVVPPGYELGWTAAAMTADPASVRKDGTLLYAYARFDATVNTVEFKGVGKDALAIDNDDVSWTGFSMAVSSGNYPDVTDDYLTLLKSSWACMHTYTHSVTLKNLTIGKTYLVQFIGCRSDNSNDAEIYVGETEDTSIFMKAGGDNWPYGGTLVGIFKAEATTKVVDLKFVKMSQDWTSWNAVQVRELGAVGPTPADAPIIGGEGVDVPMAVSSDTVSITISNAAIGHTYGYKKSTTLEGLETAEVIKLDSPAAAAGILTLDIPKDPAEPTCFYQIVVD